MRATGWTSHAEPAVPEDAVGFERSSADLWSRLVGQHARPTAITRNVLQPTWVLLVVWLSHAPLSLAINAISAKSSPTPTAYLAPMSPARGEPVTPLGWESHCLPPGLCELCCGSTAKPGQPPCARAALSSHGLDWLGCAIAWRSAGMHRLSPWWARTSEDMASAGGGAFSKPFLVEVRRSLPCPRLA